MLLSALEGATIKVGRTSFFYLELKQDSRANMPVM